jgi:predicted GTPase
MEKIIDQAEVDVVVIASPIDLRHLIDIRKPALRVRYELEEIPGSPTIRDVLAPVMS